MALLDPLFDAGVLWQGGASRIDPTGYLPTGFAILDRALGGGWRRGELTELLLPGLGMGELQLLFPAMASLAEEEKLQCWISPPAEPYAPALLRAGLAIDQQTVVTACGLPEQLWSAEQALRSGACSVLLLWLLDPRQQPESNQLRRLQLAAESGHGLVFLLRPQWLKGEPLRQLSSPASSRLLLHSLGCGMLSVELFKRRGGWPLSAFSLSLQQALALTGAAEQIHGPWGG